MARKGVNLLEGDDDEEREGDTEEEFGDDGGSYERRRGGFVDVLMVILFVCVMLGGVAWAGYQFWWLPKVKKTEQLKIARMKQEQQRRMRLAKMSSEAERAKRASGFSGRSQQPADSTAQGQKRKLGAPNRAIRPERPGPSKPAEKPPLPATASITEKPATPPITKTKPKLEMAKAGKISEKKTGPGRPNLMRKQVVEKKTEKVKAKKREGAGVRKLPRGFYYSVQVASCSTNRCANSFSKRLQGKGFSVFKVASTSRAKMRGGQMTEVRIGSFSSLAEARALASEARKKKIGARVYRYANQWRVAAGSFRNLEDAAILLDRAEDSGFRGELASRLQSRTQRRLHTIRTGKFENLRDALAYRKKIRLAGFSDAIVVRRRSKK